MVSVPYKITLLSNLDISVITSPTVSVPYKITLLSNGVGRGHSVDVFQYLIKLHYSQTSLMTK